MSETEGIDKGNGEKEATNKKDDNTNGILSRMPHPRWKIKPFFICVRRNLTKTTFHSVVMAVATVTIAIFTIKQFSVSDRQANIAEIQNEISQEQARLSQEQADISREQMEFYRKSVVIENRAYVVPNGFHDPEGMSPNTLWRFGAQVVNTGKTPALDVTTLRIMFFNIYEEPPETSIAAFERTTIDSGETLGPNLSKDVFSGKGFVSKSTYDSLRNGSLFAFLSVSIIYKDVFDSLRHTRFCARWDWDRKSFISTQKHQYFD